MSSKKESKALAEFTIMPLGVEGTSIGKYVAEAIAAINKIDGLICEVTAMGTILEAESFEIILSAVRVAHEALRDRGGQLVESTLRIDDRREKSWTMKQKVEAVKKFTLMN